MSLFASAGKSNKQLGVRIKQVRSVLEHIGLYVGLAVYTAAGAKVKEDTKGCNRGKNKY